MASEAATEAEVIEARAELVPVSAVPMPLVSNEQAKEAMDRYLKLCEAVLSDDDYQEFEQYDSNLKRRVKKRFKKKSAVKKLQTFFGLDVECLDAVRDDLGEGNFAFRVRAKATYRNGRSVEAWAACSTLEERFDIQQYNNEDDLVFERRRRKALARSYHDVLSTAETRATNRAVMNAIGVGGGEVTADEISREPKTAKQAPAQQAQPIEGASDGVRIEWPQVQQAAKEAGLNAAQLRESMQRVLPRFKDWEKRPKGINSQEIGILYEEIRRIRGFQPDVPGAPGLSVEGRTAEERLFEHPAEAPPAAKAGPQTAAKPRGRSKSRPAAKEPAEPKTPPPAAGFDPQQIKLQALGNQLFGRDREARMKAVCDYAGRQVESTLDLTCEEKSLVIEVFETLLMERK